VDQKGGERDQRDDVGTCCPRGGGKKKKGGVDAKMAISEGGGDAAEQAFFWREGKKKKVSPFSVAGKDRHLRRKKRGGEKRKKGVEQTFVPRQEGKGKARTAGWSLVRIKILLSIIERRGKGGGISTRDNPHRKKGGKRKEKDRQYAHARKERTSLNSRGGKGEGSSTHPRKESSGDSSSREGREGKLVRDLLPERKRIFRSLEGEGGKNQNWRTHSGEKGSPFCKAAVRRKEKNSRKGLVLGESRPHPIGKRDRGDLVGRDCYSD